MYMWQQKNLDIALVSILQMADQSFNDFEWVLNVKDVILHSIYMNHAKPVNII